MSEDDELMEGVRHVTATAQQTRGGRLEVVLLLGSPMHGRCLEVASRPPMRLVLNYSNFTTYINYF